MLRCGLKLFAILLFVLLFNGIAFAQYREYRVVGKVVDKDQHPLGGVVVRMQDKETSRSYTTRTDDKGVFEFVGIPHGIYSATIGKEGYAGRTDEWKFEQPQERMQKVDIPAIVLVSEVQVAQAKEDDAMRSGIDSATQKVQAGDCEAALAELKTLLEKRPEDLNALYLQGVCLLKNGSVDAAAENFRKVVAADASFVPAQLQLGMCYQKNNKPDQALESYKKVLELDSKNLAAAYDAGMILYGQKKPTEALPFFEKALSLKADDSDILEAIAYCHLQLKDTVKALEYLERALIAEKDETRHKALEEQVQKLKEAIGAKP